MGSAVFAKSLADKHANVELMICLEMIGYFTDEPNSQDYPVSILKWLYPTTGNFIAIVDQLYSSQARRLKNSMNQSITTPVYSINAPAFIPGADFSDHRNFWHQGFPAVMVTDTAFYRNTAYHTMADTIDRLDFDKMAQVTYGVYRYLLELTNKTSEFVAKALFPTFLPGLLTDLYPNWLRQFRIQQKVQVVRRKTTLLILSEIKTNNG